MSTANDVDVAVLQAATRNLTESVASIEADQWRLATPCSDWDLTALIDHITGGNWFTVAILAGERAEDAMATTTARFGGGSATTEATLQSLGDLLDAFRGPDTLDRTWNHVAGDLGGREILRLRLHDVIVHGWDVEEALRPGATVPDDLARWGLDDLMSADSLAAEHFDLVDVSAVRSPGAGSTAYLGMFGRTRRTSKDTESDS